ncbi:MAG: kynureninase, partial [Armatimonadetes bacterium]|nr:kynureninase [Armatimonadota bacterium]
MQLIEQARALDAEDPLARWREEFWIPRTRQGEELVYLSGNSLGLQPRGVEQALLDELRDWRNHGVEAHFAAERPWYSYHEHFNESAAAIVGASPGEVVVMNALTVNL